MGLNLLLQSKVTNNLITLLNDDNDLLLEYMTDDIFYNHEFKKYIGHNSSKKFR